MISNRRQYALDVFDFEAAAQKVTPPAHWGYLMSGVDGEATLRGQSRRVQPVSAQDPPVRRREHDRHVGRVVRC